MMSKSNIIYICCYQHKPKETVEHELFVSYTTNFFYRLYDQIQVILCSSVDFSI